MLDRSGIAKGHIIVAGRTLATLLLGLLAACGGPGHDVVTDPTLLGATDVVSETQLQGALQNLDARALEQPAEPYWPTLMAEWCERAGHDDEAATHLRGALALNPDYAPALSRLTRLLYAAGRHDEAIALLEAARQRLGELPEPLRVDLALHYQAAQRFDESDATWSTVENLPASLKAFRMLSGDAYLQAYDTTEEAVREHPEVASNHNNLAIALLYRGEPTQAKDELMKALQLQPDLAGAMYNLAIVEKFYFFDDEASQQWFARYRERSDVDPDGLQQLLAAEPTPVREGK